jgi:hypothetical protein
VEKEGRMKSFNIKNDRGFQLKFDNGYLLSVVFGQYNYSDSTKTNEGVESYDVEIAIWNEARHSKFVTRGVCKAMGYEVSSGAVIGRLSLSEVVKFITFLNSVQLGSIFDDIIMSTPEYGF